MDSEKETGRVGGWFWGMAIGAVVALPLLHFVFFMACLAAIAYHVEPINRPAGRVVRQCIDAQDSFPLLRPLHNAYAQLGGRRFVTALARERAALSGLSRLGLQTH